MAAVDFLPIAQPAARPDAAVARKSASAPDENGEASFAEVLETEADGAPEAKPKEEAAPADGPAPPVQPGPAPAATPPVTPVNTTAAAIIAALQAPIVQEAGAEAPITGLATSPPAAGAPSTSIVTQEAAVQTVAALTPAASVPAPATAAMAAAQGAASDSAPEVASPAPVSSASEASAGSSEIAAGAVASKTKAHLGKQAKSDEASSDVSADVPPGAAPSEWNEGAAKPSKASHPASPAPAVVAATPASDVAIQVVAAVVGGQAPPPKPVAPATSSENAPGQRRKTTADAIAPTTEAPAAPSKPGAQPAQPGVSSAQPANSQAKSPAQLAAAADAAMQDVKADAAAAAPSSTSASSSGHASFADALAASRGQVDPGRAQGANPHLQSAPSAAVQVYARFVERFDGRAQRFEVRLDPAELGRVDVRIEVGADKKVHAVLAAHDSAALSDLMRGQRSLERALSDAGIDLADNGLRFELSQDAGRNLAGQQRGDSWSNDELAHAWRAFSTVDVAVDANPADIAAATRTYSARSSRLDLVA